MKPMDVFYWVRSRAAFSGLEGNHVALFQILLSMTTVMKKGKMRKVGNFHIPHFQTLQLPQNFCQEVVLFKVTDAHFQVLISFWVTTTNGLHAVVIRKHCGSTVFQPLSETLF